MLNLDASSMIAGGGFVAAGIAIYVRLSFSDFVIKTLDDRYPTTDLLEAKLSPMTAKMVEVSAALAALPCRNGLGCNAHDELKNARQALESAVLEIVNIRKGHK
jgi:hypothetical protein